MAGGRRFVLHEVDLSGVHPPDRQREVRRQLVAPRRREEHLAVSALEQPPGEPPLPLAVELGEDIVQQQRRLGSARRPERDQLDELERHRGAPLLAGGSEFPERPAAELEDQVVAVRTDGGHPARLIPWERQLERAGPGPALRQSVRRPVPEPVPRRLAQTVELGGELLRAAAAQRWRVADDFRARDRERRVEGSGQIDAALAQRAVPLCQRAAVAYERPQISPVRQREQAVEVLPPLRRRPGRQADIVGKKGDREPRSYRVGQPIGLPPSISDPLAPAGDDTRRPPSLPRHRRARPPRPGSRGRRTGRPPGPARRETSGTAPGSRWPRAGSSCPGRCAEEDQAGGGDLAVEVRQVAEPPSHQPAEPHYSMWITRLATVPWTPSTSTP